MLVNIVLAASMFPSILFHRSIYLIHSATYGMHMLNIVPMFTVV